MGPFNFLKTFVKSFIKTEIKDTAGKVNLAGGILLAALLIAIFVPSVAVQMFAIIFNRQVSDVPYWVIVLLFVFIGIYFAYCMHVVQNKQKAVSQIIQNKSAK